MRLGKLSIKLNLLLMSTLIAAISSVNSIYQDLASLRQRHYLEAERKLNKQENLRNTPQQISDSALPGPTEAYENMQILMQPDAYILYWTANQTDVVFEVHVKIVNGWFGFGFTKDNLYTMHFSDLVIGWVNDNGTGHFSNRRVQDSKAVYLDLAQNWIPIYMAKTNSYSIFKFTRKLIICERVGNDINVNISSHSTSVIYSFGPFINGDISYHGLNRNGVYIDFLKNIDLAKLDTCKNKNVSSFKPTPSEYFTNYEELIPNKFVIYWNATNTTFTAEVHVKTNGWVGFGFSPNGNMDKSDIFIGWITNGEANFTDRFIYDKKVLIDTNNNLNLLSHSETEEYTIFKYSRPIILCDPDDRTIEAGSPYVIFAFGDTDPQQDSDISYHGFSNKGAKQLVIMGSVKDRQDQSNDFLSDTSLEVYDFSIKNVVFSNDPTYYYCKLFQVPTNLTQKRHVLKWELLMPTVNTDKIHHVVVYECQQSYNGTPAILDGNCFTQPLVFIYCTSFSYVWAVGGPLTFNFPKDTGYPIGGNTDYSYFMIELHYNNPNQEIGYIDALTLRLHATTQLQKNELGVFTVGTFPDPLALNIPPDVSNFAINSYCFNECIKPNLANNNLTFILAMPHTHLLGTEIYTSIIRNGIDIGYLYKNSYYNFDYQNHYTLDPPVVLTKDDSLITTCVYSSERTKITQGGPTTQDEMCFQFFTYYPRSQTFKQCLSAPNLSDQYLMFRRLKSEGYLYFNDIGYENDQLIKSLYAAYDALTNLDAFSEKITQDFVDLYNNSGAFSDCLSNNSLMLPKVTPSNTYLPLTPCQLSRFQSMLAVNQSSQRNIRLDSLISRQLSIDSSNGSKASSNWFHLLVLAILHVSYLVFIVTKQII